MKNILSFEALDLLLGEHAPFLVSLSDGPDNELCIVISMAEIGERGSGINNITDSTGNYDSILHDILSECRPIMPDSRVLYEIFFENYIIYQTGNESYASYDATEIRSGKYLITFAKSRLLDMLPALSSVFRSDDGTCYPGEWKHYGIYTQNHVIDVVSHYPPRVQRV